LSFHSIIKPCRLEPGDVVGIWTPSFPGPALYPRRYHRGLKAIKRAGFKVVLGPFSSKNEGFAAASPEKLAQEFHYFLRNPDIRAVFTTIGGWTMSAVLPFINFCLWRENPKIVVGYSDICSLLLAGYSRAGVVTFHGPMVLSEWAETGGPWDYTLQNFLRVVSTPDLPGILCPPKTWTDQMLQWECEDDKAREPKGVAKWRYIRSGIAEGPLLGGCLPTISLLLGTPYAPDWNGVVLFLETEEISPDEFWAHLMLLKVSGVLKAIRGLVLGRPSRPRTMATGFSDFEAILMQVLGDRRIPILVDVDLGHTEPMLTLPLGCRARIDTYGESFLSILEASVL